MPHTPFTFRVVFSGLCAFVPNRPIARYDPFSKDDEPPPDQVTVLLPDLRQPTLAHVNRKPVAIAQHVPAVVFDQRDVNETSSRSPDLLYRHQDPFHDRVFCLAAQRELIIRPDGRDPRTHQLAPVLGRLGVGLDSEQPRNAAEEQDLHWLLRMREGGVSYAKRDYNQPVPLLPDIVARVRLGEGILRSHRLSRAENDEFATMVLRITYSTLAAESGSP